MNPSVLIGTGDQKGMQDQFQFTGNMIWFKLFGDSVKITLPIGCNEKNIKTLASASDFGRMRVK